MPLYLFHYKVYLHHYNVYLYLYNVYLYLYNVYLYTLNLYTPYTSISIISIFPIPTIPCAKEFPSSETNSVSNALAYLLF
jgi:hypothetical protein